MTLTRWKLTIEYNGTPFSGWQRQDNVPSVQQAVEEAIEKFCQQEISIYSAGRTDAGVHAWGQVAHFDLDYGDRPLTGFDLAKALNAHLRPQPVSILAAEDVDHDFHARFDAQNKRYCYRILSRSAPPVLEKNRLWHFKYGLNVKAMRKAAEHLLGHHDFSTFRDSQCQAKSPMRTLDLLEIKERAYDHIGGIEVRVIAEAKSFLHHQVRNMAGTLALVGQGKWEPADVKKALEAKSRPAGGPTAPAHGLYLVKIDY